MRSSVSYMFMHGGGEQIMSHPDYNQNAYHHGCLLVLVRGIGQSKPRSLQKIFERLQRVNNVKITDSSGQVRDIWVRYVQDYPIENNDWGDFQTHRRLIGLITVGKFDTQTELNELCRVHESLKVKYTNTLFDSRCILFGSLNNRQNLTESSTDEYNSLSSNGSSIHQSYMNFNSPSSNDDSAIQTSTEQNNSESTQFTTPNNFKSRAFFYNEQDSCFDLEVNMTEFINSLFWVLESKRLERTKEKLDKVTLLLAPFEKRDFVGLDLETRNNKKRLMGRVTKNLADLTLQAGLVAESLTLFHAASETLRAISDSLWLGAANEGLCAASAILLYPNCRLTNVELQRNASLPTENSPQKITTTRVLPTTANNIQDHASQLPSLSSKVHCKKFGPNVAVNSFDIKNNVSTTTTTTKTINQTVDSSSASSSTSSVSSMVSGSSSASTPSGQIDRRDILLGTAYPSNILMPDDITNKYRDAIINYSKYRHAGIIETEAALKAARICIEQNQNLDVAMFLQNALYIDLNMTEQERVQRFETLTGLYQKIGYHRKAAFCQRLAAWRHVAKNNSNPDWNQSYRIMLDSFSGHRMSLDPIEVLQSNSGWPCLQVDLLQQLVVAARRLGHSALATRHMTFLLQTMWKHLSADAQKEMALQLQSLSSQCEGAPVPLVLESGIVIPPANLTDLPYCEHFHVKNLPPHLRPHKIVTQKIDQGPFLFTPIHFNSMQNHHKSKQSGPESKINFNWIQNDLCEVVLRLKNPLPFELRVDDMRLLTNGIVFESLPQSIVLPISSSNSAAIPNSSSSITTSITLHGTPIEYGTLDIQGYSTHTLGVKSNCRLKHMNGRKFPNNYQIDVIPALPKLDISTSLPQTATFSGMSNADSVIVSASVTLFNGENTECLVTLTNNSNVPIEFLDESIQSTLDAKLQKQIFNWSHDDIQSKLPILPNSFIEFKLLIYADADFLGPIIFGGGITSLTSSQQNHYGLSDGPQSITVGMNTLSVSGGHTSIPSRVSSPVPNVSVPQRRTELTSSFRSTHSGHSSLASISLAAAGSGGGGGGGVGGTSGYMVRHLESQFRFRYSGGEALQEGYCRQCSISFNLEFLPSAHVTNWDVLPAEIPSQFYLVLDVVNLTAQEMSLNYTSNKNILIEAKESCRVPIPVERCPLERFYTSSDGNGSVQNYTTDNPSSLLSGCTDEDFTERACSDHISDQVNLKWTLTGTEAQGITSLKGITLSSAMLSLITVAPLQWDIFIDNTLVAQQAEITCSAGQSIQFGVRISNLSPMALHQLTVTIAFYQDYQNGIHNFKLETRVIMSGPDRIAIDVLNRNDAVFHECSVIFFTPGRFKADIQCFADTSSNARTSQLHQSQFYSKANINVSKALNTSNRSNDTQIWRLIPPVEITVTE